MPTKSLFASWTFWFGFLQIVLGVVGYLSGLMEHMQAVTLIGTGIASIGLRLKTTQPITSVMAPSV